MTTTTTTIVGRAGREMDAAVAEHVMGERMLTPFQVAHGIRQNFPRYSTDIAAAWLVVEHLSKQPQPLWLELNQPAGGGHVAAARFLEILRKVNDWSFASTAPLAICIAALRAKGIGGEEMRNCEVLSL